MSWDTFHVLSLQRPNNIHFLLDHPSDRWLPLCSCITTCRKAAEGMGRGQDRGKRRLGYQMNLNIEEQTTALGRALALSLLWPVIMLLKSPAVPILVPAFLPSPPLHRHGVFVCLHEELNHKPDCLEKNESKKERHYFPAASGLVS